MLSSGGCCSLQPIFPRRFVLVLVNLPIPKPLHVHGVAHIDLPSTAQSPKIFAAQHIISPAKCDASSIRALVISTCGAFACHPNKHTAKELHHMDLQETIVSRIKRER